MVGERLVGALVGVAGDGAQRLHLADDVDPAGHVGAGARAPAFDGVGEVHGPQDEPADRREELIALRVGPVDEARQPRDLVRRRLVAVTQPLAERAQPRAGELLLLEEAGDEREHGEIAAGAIDAGVHGVERDRDRRA